MHIEEDTGFKSLEKLFHHTLEASSCPEAVRRGAAATVQAGSANGDVEVPLGDSSSIRDQELARMVGLEVVNNSLLAHAEHFPSMNGVYVKMSDGDALHAHGELFSSMSNSGRMNNGLQSFGLPREFGWSSNDAWTTRSLLPSDVMGSSSLTENGALPDVELLQSTSPIDQSISDVAFMNGGFGVVDEAAAFLQPAGEFAQPSASEYLSSANSIIPYEHDPGMNNGLRGAPFHDVGMGMIASDDGVFHDRCNGAMDLTFSATLEDLVPGDGHGSGMDVTMIANLADGYDPDMSSVWSREEQECLLKCLARYTSYNNEMKYFNIAWHLPNKTVRDVALRCRWLKEKENDEREKLGPHYVARNENGTNASNPNHKKQFPCEVPTCSTPSHLLGENNKFLNRIEEDILAGQVLNIADNFHRVKVNMDAILQRMSEMSVAMDELPPSRAPIKEEVLEAMLSSNSSAQQSSGDSTRSRP